MKEQRFTEKTEDGRYKLISEVVISNYLEKTKRAVDKLGELEDILEENNLSISDFKEICELGTMISLINPVRNDDSIIIKTKKTAKTKFEYHICYKHRKYILTVSELIKIAELNGLFEEDYKNEVLNDNNNKN